MVFCARDFSLTVRAFWRAEQLRWVETNFEEMREVDQCSDETKTVEKNLFRWHVRRDGMRWEELRWGEKRWEELTWFEMRRSVECEVQVWSVKCGAWSVHCEVWRKCSLGVAWRRGDAQVMFLDNNNATVAQSTHARAWPAHDACKFYRWERSYITLRQLPPRLERALLLRHFTYFYIIFYIVFYIIFIIILHQFSSFCLTFFLSYLTSFYISLCRTAQARLRGLQLMVGTLRQMTVGLEAMRRGASHNMGFQWFQCF